MLHGCHYYYNNKDIIYIGATTITIIKIKCCNDAIPTTTMEMIYCYMVVPTITIIKIKFTWVLHLMQL